MLGEEATALRQRDGVGSDSAYRGEFGPGPDHEAVAHVHLCFRHDMEGMGA